MNKKYIKAIECLAGIIIEQENELKFKGYEIESLKNKIKSVEAFCEQEVSKRK